MSERRYAEEEDDDVRADAGVGSAEGGGVIYVLYTGQDVDASEDGRGRSCRCRCR